MDNAMLPLTEPTRRPAFVTAALAVTADLPTAALAVTEAFPPQQPADSVGAGKERESAVSDAEELIERQVFQPGQVFHQMEIVRLVGAGYSGEVYEVRHRITGARCALKMMHLRDRKRRQEGGAEPGRGPRDVRDPARQRGRGLRHRLRGGRHGVDAHGVPRRADAEHHPGAPGEAVAAVRAARRARGRVGARRGAREPDHPPRCEAGQHRLHRGWDGEGRRFLDREGHPLRDADDPAQRAPRDGRGTWRPRTSPGTRRTRASTCTRWGSCSGR